MKVLRVIASMNPNQGGPSEGIRNSIPAFHTVGINTDVVTLDDPNSLFLTDFQPFKIYPLGPTRTPWLYSRQLYRWLTKNLAEYDVVVVHGLWLYHGFAARKAYDRMKAKKSKSLPKLYVMPHGMLDPYFQLADSRRLKAIRNTVYWHLIEKRLINHADGVLFTCEMEMELAKKTFTDYRPKRTINVGYGINKPPLYQEDMKKLFNEKCPAFVIGKPYFLFLSRIHEKKGLENLLYAYESVAHKRGEELPNLIIAGPGLEDDYGKKLLDLVRTKLLLSDKVAFTGMLSGKEKWGAFYGCEAFILPSFQENFGIAIVEAMACGKAVLISNNVNIWVEILDNKAGIVGGTSSEDIIASIEQWLNLSVREKNLMQANALQTFERNFSIEQTSKNLIDLVTM